MQNQFLRVHLGDDWHTKVLLSEPTPLTHGKTADAQITASRANWYTLRQLGHCGCAVEHYCWDRASIEALDRETRKWHLQQVPPTQLPAHISPDIAKQTEFAVVTACALHDSQNAFRWAMWNSFTDKELVRDIYIAIESLRRSADVLQSHLYEWIGEKVQVRDDRGDDWVQQRRALWLELGIDIETADLLAADLQLWWEADSQALCVLRGAYADGDLWEAIASGLMSVWRFARFTESRWLTVGSSCRSLVAGILTGIESLVHFIYKNPRASKFYLNGFGRLRQSRKEFLVVASIVGRVAEAFQYELMKDSRVAKVYDTLWMAAAKEMKWVVDLSASTYALLGSLCGITGNVLADRCISGAHISMNSCGAG